MGDSVRFHIMNSQFLHRELNQSWNVRDNKQLNSENSILYIFLTILVFYHNAVKRHPQMLEIDYEKDTRNGF